MPAIGAAEKKTQSRVVQLLVGELGYEHLGNWSEGDHQNVLEGHLEHFLFAYQGMDREGRLAQQRDEVPAGQARHRGRTG